MGWIHRGTVGIVPAGALGVAFYYHLTRELRQIDEKVVFLSRVGSGSADALRQRGSLRIAHGGEVHDVRDPALFAPDLLSGAEAGFIPEVLLVCTQPDQLLGGIANAVRLIEFLHQRGGLDAAAEFPALVLCSNGIYFQRVRQFFIEKLEESTLLGRLPDLWPAVMPRLVGRLMRGVTIQTGQREGAGADAIYRPGPLGITRLAGGDPALRERVAALLAERGGWFEPAGQTASPTRVEFDKALINLAVNLLGQLHAIDDAGRFRLLTIREILAEEGTAETRELAQRVIEIGRAVHAYSPDDDFEVIYEEILASAREHLDHVPSSLQWIEQELRRGTLQPRLTPTEVWLLDPLIRYAHAAGLEDAAHFFEQLTRRVERRLGLAITAMRATPPPS